MICSDVTGLCGFCDGSCERGTCGAGIMIQVFTKTLVWATIHKKVRAGVGPEFPRCRTGWLWQVDGKCESVDGQKYAWAIVAATSPSLANACFGGMPCTRVDREVNQVFSTPNDIQPTVASRCKQVGVARSRLAVECCALLPQHTGRNTVRISGSPLECGSQKWGTGDTSFWL